MKLGQVKEAVRTEPDDAFLRYELGECLEEQGDIVGARDAYAAALSIKPGYRRARRSYERLAEILGPVIGLGDGSTAADAATPGLVPPIPPIPPVVAAAEPPSLPHSTNLAEAATNRALKVTWARGARAPAEAEIRGALAAHGRIINCSVRALKAVERYDEAATSVRHAAMT